VRDQADLLFEPPLEGLGIRDWQDFERAVEEGYEHAVRVIQKEGLPLIHSWTQGPAVAAPELESNAPVLATAAAE
jgi:NTE family protein